MCAQDATFPISVLFWIREKSLLDLVRWDLKAFGKGAAIPGHGELFRFDECTRRLPGPGLEGEDLKLIQNRGGEANVILISDGLVARDAEGRLVRDAKGRVLPTEMVDKQCRLCMDRPPLLGLIGLHEGRGRACSRPRTHPEPR